MYIPSPSSYICTTSPMNNFKNPTLSTLKLQITGEKKIAHVHFNIIIYMYILYIYKIIQCTKQNKYME